MSSANDNNMIDLHLVGLDVLRQKWGWFLALGILLVILGMVAIGASVFVTLATMVFVGFLMIFGGILQTAHAMTMRGWSGFYLDLLAGILYIVVGCLVVAHPGATAVALTLLISVFLIMGGIFRMVVAFAVPYQNRLWLFIHGLVNLILGVMIAMDLPVSGLWVVGLFIGIDMVFNGWSLIMLSMVARQATLPK